VGIYLKTSRLHGFLLLWLVTKMRAFRKSGHRFKMEQENINRWLHTIDLAAQISYGFGLQVVAALVGVCARQGHQPPRRGPHGLRMGLH
jgi:hypothetical protein